MTAVLAETTCHKGAYSNANTFGRFKVSLNRPLCLYISAIIAVMACTPGLGAAGEQCASGSAVHGLVSRLQDKDPSIRRKAAWELGMMRSEAEAAVSQLGQACGDEDRNVRSAAALALYRIGPAAMEKLPWMNKTGAEPIKPEAAREAFDGVWEKVDSTYPMFTIRPEVDWDELREKYRPQALAARSDTELALITADMLSHLRDMHVWLKVRGRNVPVYSRKYPRNVNANTAIYQQLVGPFNMAGRTMVWAKTADKIGWVVILKWSDAEIAAQFDELLEHMRDTRGLIVDVRDNGGGDSELAGLVAGRFTDRPQTYMLYKLRSGPEHGDLSAKIPRRLVPRGPWRYDRPVILLQGRKCGSANESFCAQMAACPNVTTMGDPTKGSTGSPIWFPAAADIEVAIPQWIAYLPDGSLFDEKGVSPDTLFEYREDAFAGNKDELLSKALETLRKEPLPVQLIAGISVKDFRANEAREKACLPKVVCVEPKPESADVKPTGEIRIRFDRPMHPSTLSMQWKSGGFQKCDAIKYDEETNTFTVPMMLEASCTHRVVINPEGQAESPSGFKSIHGTAAAKFEWAFTTGPSGRRAAGERTPAVSAHSAAGVVGKYNRMRAAMRSFVEKVHTIECSQPGHAGFRSLRAFSSMFNVQGPSSYFADISDVCGVPTVFFSDGALNRVAGYYRHEGDEPDVMFCKSGEISRQDISVADPFDSSGSQTDSVCGRLKLRYGGTVYLEERRCHILESYAEVASGQKGPSRKWWIDTQSHLLLQVASFDKTGCCRTSRLFFDRINEPQAHLEAMPNVPYETVYKFRKMAEPLKNGFSGRFIQLSDGSGGEISVRWGRYGTAGEEYVGL